MGQFKVGDTVMLKSGGPVMTVIDFHTDGKVVCVWFVDGKEDKRGLFPADALKPYEMPI